MCYNCKVFDKLKLPEGYTRKYIEWHVPHPDETLQEYARAMAQGIDVSRPFVLVGHSFGAVIMQEMNRFLKPRKSIIVSSFKSEAEIPTLFRRVSRVHLAERMPMLFFSSTDFITTAFNHLMLNESNEHLAVFMTQLDPVYIKWAVVQITNWKPGFHPDHLYHIHGTEDQIFPYDQVNNVFTVQGGDHLMVFKMADTVSMILDTILRIKE